MKYKMYYLMFYFKIIVIIRIHLSLSNCKKKKKKKNICIDWHSVICIEFALNVHLLFDYAKYDMLNLAQHIFLFCIYYIHVYTKTLIIHCLHHSEFIGQFRELDLGCACNMQEDTIMT